MFLNLSPALLWSTFCVEFGTTYVLRVWSNQIEQFYVFEQNV